MTQVRKAALRVAEELVKARKDSYYRHGWASYLHRSDVEALLKAALNQTEVSLYEREIEKEPDAR